MNWENHVKFDEKYLRPTEVDSLIGDSSYAFAKLNWKATVMPDQLARIMVDHDIKQIKGHVVDVPDLPDWN